MKEFIVTATADGRRRMFRIFAYNASQANRDAKVESGAKSFSIVSTKLA